VCLDAGLIPNNHFASLNGPNNLQLHYNTHRRYRTHVVQVYILLPNNQDATIAKKDKTDIFRSLMSSLEISLIWTILLIILKGEWKNYRELLLGSQDVLLINLLKIF